MLERRESTEGEKKENHRLLYLFKRTMCKCKNLSQIYFLIYILFAGGNKLLQSIKAWRKEKISACLFSETEARYRSLRC